MSSAQLTLHSQAVRAYDGVNDLASSGPLWSGEADSVSVSASAVRFQLPPDFDHNAPIGAATLNIFVRRFDGTYEDPATAQQRHAIGILAATNQELPTTGAAVSSAPRGTEQRTIGVGTYSPALDHTAGTAYAWVAIDLTAAMLQAQSAGRLGGGYVVVLVQPLNYEPGAYLTAHGSGNTSPATLDLTYTAVSPTVLMLTSAARAPKSTIRLDWVPAAAPQATIHRSLLALQIELPVGFDFQSAQLREADGTPIPSFLRRFDDRRRLKLMIQPHHRPTNPQPIYIEL